MKIHHLATILLFCLFQGNLTIEKLIAHAEQLIKAGDKETAADELVKARSLAEKLGSRKVRLELLKRIDKHIKKVDKHHSSALRASKSAARRLLSLARKYEKIDWNRSARELALLAGRIQPGSADDLLARSLRRKVALPIASDKALEDASFLPDTIPWAASEGDVHSQELEPGQESQVLFARPCLDDWTLRCRISTTRQSEWMGILFGCRKAQSGYRLRIGRIGEWVEIHLEAIRNGVVEEIDAVRFEATATGLHKGLPLEIGLEGEVLRWTFGRLQTRRLSLPLDGRVGQLGLWAHNQGKRRFRPRFPDLTLTRR